MPESVPKKYGFPSGGPYKVKVRGDLMKKLKASPKGIRVKQVEAWHYRKARQLIKN